MPKRRGPVIDPTRLGIFLEGIRLGIPIKDAAARAGWYRTTVFDWRREADLATERGDKLTPREQALSDFADAWQNAEAEFVTGNLAVITRAAQTGQWQAAAWTLERRKPNEFGRHLLEVTGAEGGPIQVEEKLTSVLDLAAKARESLALEAGRESAPSNGLTANGAHAE